MHTGTLSKSVPNLSSFIVLEQITESFTVSAAATSYASIVDCAASSCIPILKFTGTFESMKMYEDIDLQISGLQPQLASENAVSLKRPCL